MIAWDSKYGGRVMQIRFIKFPIIIDDLTIVVDDITQMIKEGRVVAIWIVLCEVKFHVRSYVLLTRRSIYASRVPNSVEHKTLFVSDLHYALFRENGMQLKVIRGRTSCNG